MYPQKFATVDQFVVRALSQIDGLPEADAVKEMIPENLDSLANIEAFVTRKLPALPQAA